MAYTVQFRRGTTAEHSTFTGEKGEVTFNTTTSRLVVHDGTTVSGIAIAKLSDIPTDLAQLTDTTSLITEAWQAKLAKTSKDYKTLYMPTVRNMTMSDDGTKVFTVNQSYIYGYDLSIPFDLSTAVSQGNAHNYVAMVGYSNSHMIEISGNGEHLYVAHSGNGIIYQLDLATPYDITTATNANKNINIGSYENDTLSMEMNTSGTKMWTTGGASDEVHQYTLSTPYDITSAVYDDVQFNLNTAAGITTAQSVIMSTDGSKMYVFDANFDELFEFDLSSAYDISTAIYNGVSTWIQGASHATMSADGSKMYASEGSVVVQYSLTQNTDDVVTPTVSSSPWVFNMNSIDTDAKSMSTKGNLAFSNNGTKMYYVDTASNVREFDLSIPYDIGSSTYNGTWNFTAQLDYQSTSVSQCHVSPDGTKLYLLQITSNHDYLAEWTLNTPWDITSVDNSTKTKLELAHLDSNFLAYDITEDGKKMIMVGTSNDRVYEFVMTNPYDISTAYWTGARTYIGLQSSSPSSIKYSNDGTKLYMGASNTLYEYTLSTPFAVATANISSNVTEYEHDSTFAASFSHDGKYIYFNDGSTTFQYRADGSEYVPFVAVSSGDVWTFDKTSIINDNTTLNYNLAQGMTMSPDGTKLYGIESRYIRQYNLSTPYDIGTASYSYQYDAYSRIDNEYPRAIEISSDGTKMYIGQYSDDKIYEFPLSNAFHISSMSLYPTNFYIGNSEGTIQDMTLSHDGQKMFVIGSSGDKMIEYVLSTPYSISSAYWTGVTFDVSAQTTGPLTVQFNSDGTKVYVFGSGKLHEYSMTGPYSLPNISYVSSIDVDTASNVILSHTGSHMYFANGNFVRQYLSDGTAHVPVVAVSSGDAWTFDKTSIVDDNITLNYNLAQGMTMSSDGTKLYGIESRYIRQYNLSTPYDIGTASYSYQQDAYSRIDNEYPRALEISSDGTKMYIGQYSDDKIYEFPLSNAFHISSMSSYPSSFYIGQSEDTIQDMTLSHDGKKMFVIGSSGDHVVEYVLSTPYSISSAYWTGVTFDVSAQTTGPLTVQFNSDGMKFYVFGSGKLHEYSMTTAYNLSTASFVSSTDIDAASNVILSPTGSHMYFANGNFVRQHLSDGTVDTPVVAVSSGDVWTFDKTSIVDDNITLNYNLAQGMTMSPDGTKLYGIESRYIRQYNLSTPYDIGTASYSYQQDAYSRIDNEYPRALEISSDGTKMYIGQYTDDKIFEFPLSNAFHISSMSSYPSSFYIGNSEDTIQDMTLSHDGKKMFVIGSSGDHVVEYVLSTPYSISSAYWTGVTFDVSGQTSGPLTVQFNSDGMKFYVFGSAKLHEYSMTTAYNLSTASFVSSTDIDAASNVILSHTGSRMYFSNGNFVRQYLSDGTAHVPVVAVSSGDVWTFDKTSIINDNTTLNYNLTQGMTMSPDGTKLYGIFERYIREYNLSTPYDIGTASYSYQQDAYSRIDNEYPRAIEISSDGTKMYIGQYTDDKIFEFPLSNTFQISSMSSYPSSFYIGQSEDTIRDMTLSHDGKKMFVIGSNGDHVVEYVLSTPYSISSAYWTGVTFDVSAQTSVPLTVQFNSDGTKFYVFGSAKLHEYSMTTAYNLSTASFVSSIDVDTASNVILSHTGSHMYFANGNFVRQYLSDGTAHVPVAPVSSGDAWTFDNANIVHLQDNTTIQVNNFTMSSDGTKLYGINSRYIKQYNLSTAYDIATATYSTQWDAYSRIDNEYPSAIEISSDGTKMYIGQYTDDKIFEFLLSTPFSLSSTIYSISSTYIGNSEDTIRDMALSHDGQKMFVIGSSGDHVVEYVLSTPYVVSSAYWTGVTFSVSVQTTSPTNICISTDGNSFYIASSGYLHEYSMTTPYDLSTAAFVSTIADGLHAYTQISNIGTYLYSSNGSEVSQYTSDGSVLAPTVPQASLPGISLHIAPWRTGGVGVSQSYAGGIYTNGASSYWLAPDNSLVVYIKQGNVGVRTIETRTLLGSDGILGTVGYDSTTSDFNPSSQMGGNADVVKLSSDKTKLYISDTNKIYQYTLSVAGDLDTAVYDNFYDVTVTTTSMNDFVFSSDGTSFYVLNDSGITQFSLSVAWDITSTVTIGGTFSITNEMTSAQNLGIVDSDNYVYVYTTAVGKIFKYTLGTAKDITTASLASSQDFASVDIVTAPSPAFFPIDGKSVIIKGSDRVYNTFYFDANDIPYINHTAPTATGLDITLASYDNVTFNTEAQDFAPTDVTFKPDGTQMYVVGDANDKLYQYSLGTAWDLSTASFANKSLDVFSETQSPRASSFINSDGTKVYIIGRHHDKVHQYSLSTPWDVSTGSFDNVDFSVTAQDSNPVDMTFYSNGTKMLVLGYGNGAIYQYSLSVGFDLSTAVYDNISYSVSSETTVPTSFVFSADGKQMFILDWSSGAAYQYDLSTAFDITTLSFANKSLGFTASVGAVHSQSVQSITFKPDGTKMFVTTRADELPNNPGGDVGIIHQFSTNGSFPSTSSIDITTPMVNLNNVYDYNISNTGFAGFIDNGNKFVTFREDQVDVHNMSVPYDITSVSSVSGRHIVESSYYNPSIQNVSFSGDGNYIYLIYNQHNNVTSTIRTVHKYSLSIPFDISSTLTDRGFVELAALAGQAQQSILDLKYTSDMKKFYVLLADGSLSEMVDLTVQPGVMYLGTQGWYYTGSTFDTGTVSSGIVNITVADDGTKIFLHNTSGVIHQLDLSTAFELTSATYNNVKTDSSNVTSNPINRAWIAHDGSRYATLEYSAGKYGIHLYSINGDTAVSVTPVAGPAWTGDITTPINSLNKTFSYSGMMNDGLCGFADNGNYVITIGGSYDEYVHTHSLSTPYDVSTKSGTTSTHSQTSSYYKPYIKIAKWSTDGTKLYTVNDDHGNVADSGYLRQRNATTPFNGSTATSGTSYNARISSNNGIYGTIQDFTFSYDGSKMYVLLTDYMLYENILTTPWEINTSYWSGKSYNLSSKLPYNIQITDDGTKMHVHSGSYTISELDFGTAFDISTLTDSGVITATIPNASNNAWISNDGSRIIAQEFSRDRVALYSINGDTAVPVTPVAGPAWTGDITTPINSLNKTFSYSGMMNDGLCGFADNGNYVITIGGSYDEYVYTHSLSTPYDISTKTGSTSTHSQTNSYYKPYIKIAKWSTDGTKLYTVNDDHGNVADSGYLRQRNATTPFNGGTATGGTSYNARGSWNQGIYGTIQDFTFSHDGSKMYVLLTDYMLYENILTTPWEINTSYWSGKSYDLSSKLPYNIQITDDGTKMHVHSGSYTISELDFGTAFDISTLTDSGVITATIPNASNNAWISNDGSRIIAQEFSHDRVALFSINGDTAVPVTPVAGPAWTGDITNDLVLGLKTFSYSNIQHFCGFADNGNYMITLGGSYNEYVYTHSLSTPYDISTKSGTTSTHSQTNSYYKPYVKIAKWSTDGTKLYTVNDDHGNVADSGYMRQRNATTPFNGGTATGGTSYNARAGWNQGMYGTIQDFTFSHDGSKLYVLLTDYILYENILTTPWEINTSYWSGKSYDLSSKLPYNIQIIDDGTKMHVTTTSNVIRELDFGTAFDILTLTDSGVTSATIPGTEPAISNDGDIIVSRSGDVLIEYKIDGSVQGGITTTVPVGYNTTWNFDFDNIIDDKKVHGSSYSTKFVSNDGTKLYQIHGSNKRVHQYELSIPHDISSAVSGTNGQSSTTLSNLTDTLYNVFVSPDGTNLYAIDFDSKLYHYVMSTPHDLSTAVYTALTTATSGITSLRNIEFSPDGKIFILYYATGKTVRQYICGTPWDITTSYWTGNDHVFETDNIPHSFQISADGTKAYTFMWEDDKLREYTMSNPWDISTLSSTPSNTHRFKDALEVFISPDGSRAMASGHIYRTDGTAHTPVTATGSSITWAADITSLVDANKSFDTGYGHGSVLSEDGTKLYTMNGQRLDEHTLSIAHDISSASFDQAAQLGQSPLGGIDGFVFRGHINSDGTKFYVLNGTNPMVIYQYDFGTPFDVSTLTKSTSPRSDSYFKSIIGESNTSPYITGFAMSYDGKKLFHTRGERIVERVLETPFDITTEYKTGNEYWTGDIDSSPASLQFSSDGLKLYMFGQVSDSMYEFTMTTAYDLSTMSYSGVTKRVRGGHVVNLSSDGTKMYVKIGTTLHQYNNS